MPRFAEMNMIGFLLNQIEKGIETVRLRSIWTGTEIDSFEADELYEEVRFHT